MVKKRNKGEPVAAEFDDGWSDVSGLLRDLEFAASSVQDEEVDLTPVLESVLQARDDVFKKVAADASLVAAAAGDWKNAFALIDRLSHLEESPRLKLWKLRCLIELCKFSEALTVAQALAWPTELMIHVNYLTALGFEGLGFKDQARMRFEAVKKRDPRYRDVQEKLSF